MASPDAAERRDAASTASDRPLSSLPASGAPRIRPVSFWFGICRRKVCKEKVAVVVVVVVVVGLFCPAHPRRPERMASAPPSAKRMRVSDAEVNGWPRATPGMMFHRV